ncbi:MAG: TolC family protein [Myxococcales bacterium]|nr:TolC family protein [Myxococcales bacterium]
MWTARTATLLVCALLLATGCVPSLKQKAREANKKVPGSFRGAGGGGGAKGSGGSSAIKWRELFSDSNLQSLIGTALKNNQELHIALQEIRVVKSEIMARRGEYLPKLGAKVSAGLEKVGKYTSQGASDATTEYKPGKEVPEHLQNYSLGFFASWEIDVWAKLRNATKSAMFTYLSTVEGRKFMVTRLVSEIARSYYELMALDNRLDVVKQNIKILQNALKIVELQKEAAKVTELAVQRFKAEVLKNQSREFDLRRKIIATENRINFLVGRFPQPVARSQKKLKDIVPRAVNAGLPSQLLSNRPDVKRAELLLEAAKLDVKVAKASFYPSLSLEAGVGYQAFYPKFLFTTPESLFYSVLGGITMPLLNRKGLTARYFAANAKQMQAVYTYERTILKAVVEVSSQLAAIRNLEKSVELKSKQVQTLTRSIDISNQLFRSARANYMEVLMTRRDALESQLELIETKKAQLEATVRLYQALGGGWRS